jgi:hypothetical protein
VLWAAYAAADLPDDALPDPRCFGPRDTGRESFTDPVIVARLGPDLVMDESDGGNPAQRGGYPGQPNDPPATISREEQQARIVADAIALLDRINAGSSP